ncbi:MAG: flavin reductase family protein [Streptosporangiaceae bacterium]
MTRHPGTGHSGNEISRTRKNGSGLSGAERSGIERSGAGSPGDAPAGEGRSGRDISAAEFRDAMGHFATGVTVVTSVDAEGQPVGTTANAVTSLSVDPPLVIVCFDLGSVTLQAIRSHGAFVVNVLAAPQQHLSRNFARRGLAAAWDGVEHRRGPTGSPRLEDVLAVLECTVEHALPGGDHEIIVGRVRHVETSANPNGPLVFFRGTYASLTDQELPACG